MYILVKKKIERTDFTKDWLELGFFLLLWLENVWKLSKEMIICKILVNTLNW